MGVSNIKEGNIYPTKSFGNVVVTRYIDKYNVNIKFLNTESEITVTSVSLRSGSCVDYNVPTFCGVGYIGYGIHSTRQSCGKKKSRAYEYWGRMLKRCYDKTSQDYETYGGRGVEVCIEWHNFQNFAIWFYSQQHWDRSGYHLDKDLLIVGNKTYCPEACSIVPAEINTLGIFTISDKFGMTTSGKWRYQVYETKQPSKSYETKEECRYNYLVDKRDGMKRKILLNYLSGNISEELYHHLINLVDITHPLNYYDRDTPNT